MKIFAPIFTSIMMLVAYPALSNTDNDDISNTFFELLKGKTPDQAEKTLKNIGFNCYGSMCIKFEHVSFTNKQKQRRMMRTTTRVTLPKGEIRRQSDLVLNHQVTTYTPSTRTQDAD
jgi:hypothetical protein